MEEVKFVSVFPELNNKIINKTTQNREVKNFLKTKKIIKKVPINILLNSEHFNLQNKRVETDFFKNKNKLFSMDTTINTRKSNFFPYIEKKNLSHRKFGNSENTRNINMEKENTSMVYKMFDKFDKVSRKYDEHTKYYNLLIKKGYDNNRKMHIKAYSNISPSFHMIHPKNNCKKRCSFIYKKIKKIQE